MKRTKEAYGRPIVSDNEKLVAITGITGCLGSGCAPSMNSINEAKGGNYYNVPIGK